MKFYLYSATQNTFFFISESELETHKRPSKLKNLTHSQLAAVVCKHFGSNGADGFVIVKNSKIDNFIRHNDSEISYDYEWEFYNKDGSSADMCGNASRCMALFAREKLGFNKSVIKFKTLAGIIEVKYLANQLLSVHMTDHKILIWENKVDVSDGESIAYSLIDTGVPHAVLEVNHLQKDLLLKWVKIFRFKKEFGTLGANVSFLKKDSIELYEGITFERGVEDFTLSCGTGVVAMALSIFHKCKEFKKRQMDIKTPGGLLNIELDSSNRFCWLTGTAELIEIVEGWN